MSETSGKFPLIHVKLGDAVHGGRETFRRKETQSLENTHNFRLKKERRKINERLEKERKYLQCSHVAGLVAAPARGFGRRPHARVGRGRRGGGRHILDLDVGRRSVGWGVRRGVCGDLDLHGRPLRGHGHGDVGARGLLQRDVDLAVRVRVVGRVGVGVRVGRVVVVVLDVYGRGRVVGEGRDGRQGREEGGYELGVRLPHRARSHHGFHLHAYGPAWAGAYGRRGRARAGCLDGGHRGEDHEGWARQT